VLTLLTLKNHNPSHLFTLSHCWVKVLLICLALSPSTFANDIQLPELGDASSSIVSPQKERQLGQTWLRMYRSQVPTFSDPQMYVYLEDLLNELAQHSQLVNRQLDLILVKNSSLNAFAVPGGVVGVHTGLLTFAESEAQLASVLSHELAHLSQRHFARSVEQQRKNQIPFMAAMLGSLILAATTGGDAGIAALTATQAAALDSKLRFSRKNEQEADRIGMLTMTNAGIDPSAMGDMFENMLQTTRYSQRPPEFLLTHPVTENRIADARGRASQYPMKQYPAILEYHLMRARALMVHADTPQAAVKYFRSEVNGESLNKEASRYGLALSLTQTNQLNQAQEHIQILLDRNPNKGAYLLAQADIHAAGDNIDTALTLLADQLSKNPDNHPFNIRYAELLLKAGLYPRCEEILKAHVKRRPKDDYVWYLLAEVHGLAGDILGVHMARAEYFILNGTYDKAQKQLNNALKLSKKNYHQTALLEERLKDIKKMQDKSNFNI
jgi:predicted Zn-dependent protease